MYRWDFWEKKGRRNLGVKETPGDMERKQEVQDEREVMQVIDTD